MILLIRFVFKDVLNPENIYVNIIVLDNKLIDENG